MGHERLRHSLSSLGSCVILKGMRSLLSTYQMMLFFLVCQIRSSSSTYLSGIARKGLVYELFFTDLPQSAFTAADVVALYLHRGAFEPVLADEDQEQDPDRWCSHFPCGQQAWHIVSQWVWNLRLELGHQLEPTPMRTTEFAPAAPEA